MKNKKNYFGFLTAAATLIIGITLGVLQTRPPHISQSSPLYPKYEHMMDHLQKMTMHPHPSNSPEIKIVRELLLAEIQTMGLTPAIQEFVYTREDVIDKFLLMEGLGSLDELDEWWRSNGNVIPKYFDIHDLDTFMDVYFDEIVGEEGRLSLTNILVKLEAPDTDRGVLFVAHYDSVAESPGAADDMLGIVSMLEALRAQSENDALQNNLYFLFTDGEEPGLYGAFEFAEDYPELKDNIDLVINIEARGNGGKLMLFETSPNAYQLVKAAKKSGSWLYGYSIGAKIYSMMPNTSDFSVFLQEGYSGLNFAAIEGFEVYHTMKDSYENLDRSTAWHYLESLMLLADYAANNPLEGLQNPSREAVFFPFLPGGMVLMTDIASHILCAITCIWALVILVLRFKKLRLRYTLSTILMGLLIPASIACAIFFVAGSYLLYLPLLLMAITLCLNKKYAIHIAAKMVSGIIILLLWVPVFIVTWWTLVLPMML